MMHVRPGGDDAIAQHLVSLVEVHERQLREPVDFRQCFAKRLNGGVRAGGDGQRVGERGKRARRHPGRKMDADVMPCQSHERHLEQRSDERPLRAEEKYGFFLDAQGSFAHRAQDDKR